MKIALCISGQPRGLEHNIPRLLEGLVIPSDIEDIFIHTWFDDSLIGVPFSSAQPDQTGKVGVWAADTIELLKRLNPIRLEVEYPKSFDELSHLLSLPSAIQTQLASNIYSVYRANRLKCDHERVTGVKYDLVIRARIDCEYDQPYDITQHLDPKWDTDDVLHIPHKFQHMRMDDSYPILGGGTYSSMSDTLAYGRSEVVDKFCSVYPQFESIHHHIKPYQYGECFFGYQTRHRYKIRISMQPIDYHLVRG